VHVSLPPSSGSNPTTKSAGPSTITVYKRYTITGRAGRFIPVFISTKKPRKFVLTIVTFKGNHHVAVAFATLKKKGHETVELRLAKNTKPGKYLILVRVFTLGGHGLALKVTVAFILV
jgi:hypothetical protein